MLTRLFQSSREMLFYIHAKTGKYCFFTANFSIFQTMLQGVTWLE